MTTDQTPKPKSSVWKRHWLLAVLALASLLLLVLCLPIDSNDSGSKCAKCFITKYHRSLYICGVRIYDDTDIHYSGTPELKAWQHVCQHLLGGSSRSMDGSILFGTLAIGCGGIRSQGCGYAKLAEQGGMDVVVEDFGPGSTDYDRADWAWFMQKASGMDFGVTYDDEHRQPIMPPGTIEKIMAWWKAEGKAKYPSK